MPQGSDPLGHDLDLEREDAAVGNGADVTGVAEGAGWLGFVVDVGEERSGKGRGEGDAVVDVFDAVLAEGEGSDGLCIGGKEGRKCALRLGGGPPQDIAGLIVG